MTLKVKTSTGLSDVLDLKIKAESGTFTDVQRLVQKQGDALVSVWERDGVPPPPPPPALTPPVGVDPFILTVRVGNNDSFTIPIRQQSVTMSWIVDWGDGQMNRVKTVPALTHPYTTAGDYRVRIYPATASATNWLWNFGTARGSHWNSEANRTDGNTDVTDPAVQANLDKIVGVDGVITPQMVASATDIAQGKVGDGVCSHWFFGCRNLTMSDTFTFSSDWNSITEVGGGFCYGMFMNCSGDQFTMGRAFNLPQNIQRIKSSGAIYLIPNWYQSPGYGFCTCMFYGCSGAAFNMNNVFTLPQTLIMLGAWFCESMFSGCSGNAFTMGAAFNMPQNITKLAAPEDNSGMGHVCENMFSQCSGAAFTMNSVFQLPQGLLKAGLNTFARMFTTCSGALFTMNNIFTLPQVMIDTSSGLANGMFSQCTGSGFQVGAAFRFPPLLTQQMLDMSGNLINVFHCWTNKTYHRQNRTIASIINGLPAPSSAKGTFHTYDATQGANRWSDWDSIDSNWRTV